MNLCRCCGCECLYCAWSLPPSLCRLWVCLRARVFVYFCPPHFDMIDHQTHDCNEIFPRVFPFHVISYCGFRAKCGCVRSHTLASTLAYSCSHLYTQIQMPLKFHILFYFFTSSSRVCVRFEFSKIKNRNIIRNNNRSKNSLFRICLNQTAISLWWCCCCCFIESLDFHACEISMCCIERHTCIDTYFFFSCVKDNKRCIRAKSYLVVVVFSSFHFFSVIVWYEHKMCACMRIQYNTIPCIAALICVYVCTQLKAFARDEINDKHYN